MKENSRLYRLIFGDGRELELPATRRESFKQYGKMHFIKLMIFGVFTGLFFLPALVWLYSANYSRASAIASLDTASVNYTAEYASVVLQHTFRTYLILIPLAALFFVGLSGMLGAAKRISFYQSCSYTDFFRAVKKNGLGSAAVGLLYGFMLLLFSFNLTYFEVSSLSPVTRGILSGISIILFFIITVFSVYLMSGLAVYTNTARGHLINSLKLTFGIFFKNLIVMGLIFLPFILVLLIPAPWQVPLLSLLPPFYIGFAALALMCYANSIFDLYINPTLGGDFVGRGLKKANSCK